MKSPTWNNNMKHLFFTCFYGLAQAFTQQADPSLQAFFQTDKPLYLEQFPAGSFNPPSLVYAVEGPIRTPLGVIKWEKDTASAAIRLRLLDDLIQRGCRLIPQVLRGGNGDYLLEYQGKSYSCMEYLKQEMRPTSFEEMLHLTAELHRYLKGCHLTQSHFRTTLDWFSSMASVILQLNPLLKNKDSSLFETSSWETCVRSTNYFLSTEFRTIYDHLPVQVIHGDLVDHNVIYSSEGKPYFIDFESMRIDIRLRDFATFSSVNFLDHFLNLVKSEQLEDCLRTHYGELEEMEIAYLPQIVLLERCCALAWSLDELSKAIVQQDQKQRELFRQRVEGAIAQIDRINGIISFMRLPFEHLQASSDSKDL